MNRFDTPLLPEWLDGGLQGAVLAAATTLVLACWLTGEPLDKTGKQRAAQAAEAAEAAATRVARSITLPAVLVAARGKDDYLSPVTTALASASRDCGPGAATVGGTGVNLHQ